MKEFLYDMFIDPFTDGFWSVLFGILMWLFMLVLVGLIIWGAMYLVDSSFPNKKQGIGVIVEKGYEPPYTTLTYVVSGKVMIPTTIYHPEFWYAKISINDLTDCVFFNENDWNTLSINQKVNCTYISGRIWNSLYIKNVSW